MKRVSRDTTRTSSSRTGTFYAERIVQKFADRRYTLYRRTDISDSSWFLCIYLREEKRQYRVSLKTEDREKAKRKVEGVLVDLLGRVRSGEKILAPSLGEILTKYNEFQQKRVDQKQIAANTLNLQSYRVNTGLRFIKERYPTGLNTKITAIDGEVFKDYLDWRTKDRKTKGEDKTIRLDVVRDELIAIRKLFLFARDNKCCSDKCVPVWDFKPEKESPKRRPLDDANYRDFLNSIRQWKGKAANTKDRYHRELLHHVVLVIGASGMRTGEVFGLRNKDIRIFESEKNCRSQNCVRRMAIARDAVVVSIAPICTRAASSLAFWASYSRNQRGSIVGTFPSAASTGVPKAFGNYRVAEGEGAFRASLTTL